MMTWASTIQNPPWRPPRHNPIWHEYIDGPVKTEFHLKIKGKVVAVGAKIGSRFAAMPYWEEGTESWITFDCRTMAELKNEVLAWLQSQGEYSYIR